MKSAEITDDLWEAAAANRSDWRRVIRTGVKRAEAKREQLWHDKRERQRARATSVPSLPTAYICRNCDRNCHSRIELYSHSRRRLLQYSKLTFPAQSNVVVLQRTAKKCNVSKFKTHVQSNCSCSLNLLFCGVVATSPSSLVKLSIVSRKLFHRKRMRICGLRNRWRTEDIFPWVKAF